MSLIYFKTQHNLSCQSIGWIKLLKQSNKNVIYKPGKEPVTADALSCLYSQNPKGLGGFDPNWPLLTLKKVGDSYYTGTSPKTIQMVAKDWDKFIDSYSVVHQVLDNKSTVPYAPTHQRVNTILK